MKMTRVIFIPWKYYFRF